MNKEIQTKLQEIMNKTNTDDIIWKRITPTCYSFARNIPYDGERKLIQVAKVVYTITKNEGNFLMTGHDIRYIFEINNKDNEETILRIESDKNSEEEVKTILSNIYEAIDKQQLRKITTILNASI